MKTALLLFAALCLVTSSAYSVISVNQQVSKVDLSYSSGVATATLATFDGSSGNALSPFTANLALDNQFRLTISAPVGMKFVANLPQGAPRLFLDFLNFNNSDFKNNIQATSPTITYTGFTGSGGAYSGGDIFSTPANGSNLGFGVSTGAFSSSFQFQSVSILWSYNAAAVSGATSTLYSPTGGQIRFFANMVATDPGNWLQIQPVPEPGSMALIAAIILTLVVRFSCRSRAQTMID